MNDVGHQSSFRYDPFSVEAMRDPYRFYPTLREEFPAYFIPEYDTYVFSRYADVWDGFMDGEHFSEAERQLFSREDLLVHHRGNPPQPVLDPMGMFLFLDPPLHTGFRRALAPPFTKPNVGKLAEQITTLVRDRLAELLPRGRFDLNTDFGSYVSAAATSTILGFPISDAERLVSLVNRMVAREGDKPGGTPDGVVARNEVMDYLISAVAARRAGRSAENGIIDPLITADLIGRPLTDPEVAIDLLSILVGGSETVPKVLAGGILALWKQPDQLAQVLADPVAAAAPLYEESLRYCAPAQWFGRTVKKRHELGGVTLEPGQRVILLIAAANRDPREFDAPESFIWNREHRRMLSFGVGPHFCIGAHLARLEGQIMVRELLSAAPRFTLEPEAGDWAVSEFQVGWTKLPIRID